MKTTTVYRHYMPEIDEVFYASFPVRFVGCLISCRRFYDEPQDVLAYLRDCLADKVDARDYIHDIVLCEIPEVIGVLESEV